MTRKHRLNLSVAIVTLVVLWAPITAAQAPEWTILSDDSRIELEGTINGALRSVDLPAMTGAIRFDPDDLDQSEITIDIPITEIHDFLDAAVTTLKSVNWFDTKHHATARFHSNRVTAFGDDNYTAEGDLTLKGTTRPASLDFSFSSYGPDPDDPDRQKAEATANAVVNRLDFDIGTGWNKKFPEYKIGEEVRVKITITATRPAHSLPETPPK